MNERVIQYLKITFLIRYLEGSFWICKIENEKPFLCLNTVNIEEADYGCIRFIDGLLYQKRNKFI